jgi:hypothetical protein
VKLVQKMKEEVMVEKIKRKCRYCNNFPTGKNKVCSSPTCQAKMLEDRKLRQRKAAKIRSDKARSREFERNPMYCECCGAQYTILDKRTVPACHRDECQEWWKDERIRRIKIRTKNSNQKLIAARKAQRLNATHRMPKLEPFIVSPNDFSQKRFIEETKESAKKNGWFCVDCGKELRGANRFRCARHRKRPKIHSDERTDGAYSGGGETGVRTFCGVQ